MEKTDCINIYTKHKSQTIIDMDISSVISIILNMPMACDKIFPMQHTSDKVNQVRNIFCRRASLNE